MRGRRARCPRLLSLSLSIPYACGAPHAAQASRSTRPSVPRACAPRRTAKLKVKIAAAQKAGQPVPIHTPELEAIVTEFRDSPEWQEALERNQWTDTFMVGPEFEESLARETEFVNGIWEELGY